MSIVCITIRTISDRNSSSFDYLSIDHSTKFKVTISDPLYLLQFYSILSELNLFTFVFKFCLFNLALMFLGR